jgi:hypothetical protein
MLRNYFRFRGITNLAGLPAGSTRSLLTLNRHSETRGETSSRVSLKGLVVVGGDYRMLIRPEFAREVD